MRLARAAAPRRADLKNTGKGNLFVIFGEPDIDLINEKDGKLRVKVNGVDVFKPQTGEVVSDSADGIACWFIDTDYEESFFARYRRYVVRAGRVRQFPLACISRQFGLASR